MGQNFRKISNQTLIPTFDVLSIQIMTKLLFFKPLWKILNIAQIFLVT